MRRLLGLTVLAFAVGLGVVVGYRMSSEAMAVVVGVVCGVLASIPMSLLILVVSRRTDRSHYEEHYERRREYPPVVVVNPGGVQQLPSLSSLSSPYPTQLSVTREFKVIGEDQ